MADDTGLPNPVLVLSTIAGLAVIGSLAWVNRPNAPEISPEDMIEPAVLQTHSTENLWAARRPIVRDRKADSTPPVGFDIEPPDIIRLGWGWSQSRSEAIPTVCVVFREQPRDDAQDASIEISEVRDSYSLAKQMKISGSVSVKTVVASGSAKAEFAKKSNVSSTAVTYLVSAEVMNAARFAAPAGEPTTGRRAAVRLTEDAARLARENPEAFQDICGEGYVSAVKTGARAYMLASTKTTTKSARETVRASVKGEGWGVKVAAAATGSSATSSEKYERTLSFYQQGGAAGDGVTIDTEVLVRNTETGATDPEFTTKTVSIPASDLPSDAAEGIARIKKLAEAAAAAGEIFEAHVTPYQVLENFPRGENLLAEEEELDEIAAVWGAYNTLVADLKMALEKPADYAVPLVGCKKPAEADEVMTCSRKMVAMTDPAAMRQAEDIQDMALNALWMIEEAATHCLEAEEACDFDMGRVRSPYSVRASMPMLIDTVTTAATPPTTTVVLPTVDDHVAVNLREASQGRCVFGALTPGCILNEELRGWAERAGLASVVTADPAALLAAAKACGVPETHILTGEASDPDAPTFWYPVDAFDAGTGTCTGQGGGSRQAALR